jgi:hypothetical protein
MLDPTIKLMPVFFKKMSVLLIGLSFIAIATLLLFHENLGEPSNRALFFCLLTLIILCLSIPLMTVGGYIFFKNIKSYKKQKISIGLNKHGRNSENGGLRCFLFNQILAVGYFGIGSFLASIPLFHIVKLYAF